ncbi:MAG: PGF-pre-PGF domain-containing protein [Nanoarchaeota archaeon]|nr:PGF-pre-PGF domain-containing protein [DPANN group archaeon]MBL7116829.1 PGF-pre-PGF domain-containing protein [Nanoarchaeota archaeon]
MDLFKLSREYIILYTILLIITASFASANLEVVAFTKSGLDSQISNTGIIGNTYTFYLNVKNNGNSTFNFTTSGVNLTSNDTNDTLSLISVSINGTNCVNCSLTVNDTGTITYNWTVSNKSGTRNFSLNIGSEVVTFSNSTIGVNSIMDEVIEVYDDVRALVVGNRIWFNVTGINFTDTVFQYIYIEYGNLTKSLNDWGSLWLGFYARGHVTAGNVNLTMDEFNVTHPNLITYIEEYCKIHNEELNYTDQDCIGSYQNLTMVNAMIELARSTARFRIVNWTFDGNLTKTSANLYGGAVYGNTTEDMLNKIGDVLTESVPSTPLPVLTLFDVVTFRDLSLDVMNSTAGEAIYDGNNISGVAGTYTVYVNYTDQYDNKGRLPITAIIQNSAPSTPIVNIIPATAYAENNLNCSATNSTDIDGDAVTYVYAWTKDGVSTSFTTATIQFNETKVGQNWTCSVYATDGTENSSTVSASVIILLGNNTAPNITGVISNMTTTEDNSTSQNISGYRYDLEEEVDDLTWNIQGVNESLFFATVVNNILTISPVTYGFDVITLLLLDSVGASDSQQLSINITNVNEAPIITSTPTTTATEDEEYTYQVSAIDTDGDTLNYSLDTNPSGMSINSSTGLISWTPTNAQADNTYSVSVVVSDGTVSDQQNYSIYIASVNDAPIISGVPDQNGTEDISFTLNVSSNVSDVDNTLLTISSNSTYATVSGYIITFEYPDGVTSESVRITVSDGQLTASDTITVTITVVNDAPSTPSIKVTPKSPIAGDTLTCNVTVESVDVDNTTIYYNYTWYKDNSSVQTNYTTQTTSTLSSTASGTSTYECNVTVTDGQYTTDRISDSVKVGNSAPTTPVVDVTPNVAYTDDILVCNATNSTDANNDTVTYTYKWFRKSSGQTQFYLQTPTSSELGSGNTTKSDAWKCEVKAFDSSAYSGASSDTVTVLNTKPNITSATPSTTSTTTDETTNKAFSILVSDADTDSLTTTWYLGSTFVSTTNYTYTPSYTSAGTYTVKVVVSDGDSTAERSWTLTVTDVNRNPTIDTISSQTCNERDTCTIYVSASDQDTDNTLTYYDNSTLFTIDSSSGEINFTVADISADISHSIRITVVDSDGGYATQMFNLTLNNVNRKPVLNPIGTLSSIENTTFIKQVSATDADGDSLTYSNSPTTLFTISSSGLINFTPNSTHALVGNYSTNITVSDGNGGTDTEEIMVFIKNTNNAPTIDSYYPSSTSITINESQSQYFNITTSDSDGTTPNKRWYKDGALVSQTDNYNFTTDYTSGGTHTTILAVVDDGLANDTQTWTVTVSNVNRAPAITSISTQQAVEDQGFSYTVSVTDADSDTVVYSTNSSLFTIGVLTGVISFVPTQSNVGTHPIKVFVADGTVRVNTTFTLNISNVNDAPVLSSVGSLTAIESQTFTKQVSATDDDSDSLTYSDDIGLFDISSSGVISFIPTFQDSGTYPVRITVSDGNGGTDFEDITVTVLETNQAPSITAYSPSSSSVSMLEDNSTAFNATATDADGTTPSIKWYLNDALVETGSSYTFTGNFTFEGSNAGNYNITAVATDGLLNDTQTWALQVNRTRDSDEDLVPDYRDNCELVYNPDQTDLDGTTSEGLLCENNVDGDDVLDDEDFVNGTADNLETNVDNVELKIENSSDLNRVINETQPVVLSYTEYNTTTGQATEKQLVNFNFTFNTSSKLDLGDLSVKTQKEDETTGAIVVAGIDLSGEIKSLYIDELDTSQDGVCIKDAVIIYITDISSGCTGTNETLLTCSASGTFKSFQGRTYTCTDEGSTLRIDGLVHSGVRQDSCTSSWSCSSWSTCVGGTQSCDGSWSDANSCGPSYSGSNTQSCTVEAGGGGFDSQVEAETIPEKTGVWSTVAAGELKSLQIDTNIVVNLVEFKLLDDKENVKLTVKQVTSPSVTKAGKVYKYLEIEKENFENSDIESVTISFRVGKSWLSANELASDEVALFRYASGWEELTTAVDREDDNNIYYKATTPGFSTFAIGEKGVVEELVPEEEAVEEVIPTGEVAAEPEVEVEPPAEVTPAEKKKVKVGWVVIVLLLVVLLIVFLNLRKPKEDLIESHLKKADRHKIKASNHRKKASEHEQKGYNDKAKKHRKKARAHESKENHHRKQAQHYNKLVNLKKAMELHKKGEAFYNTGHYEKSQKYYKLAQKYRDRAHKKI